MTTYHTLKLPSGINLYHTGPDLTDGPLPALFYFTLTGEDSICLSPINQPVTFTSHLPWRIFSLTLPCHASDIEPTRAIELWSEEIAKGNNIIETFLGQIGEAIAFLQEKGALIDGKVGVSGLSRGGYMSLHAAARFPQIFGPILCYAPMTRLHYAKEFKELQDSPILKALDLKNHYTNLTFKPIHIEMGNRDIRVGTTNTFELLMDLSELNYKNGNKSPDVTMNIVPAIGKDGHGTAPETFRQGIFWMARQLEALDPSSEI